MSEYLPPPHVERAHSGLGPHYRGFTITITYSNGTPHSAGLLWTNEQPNAEISTCQHTALTRDRHPRHRRDSNLQSQPASTQRDRQVNIVRPVIHSAVYTYYNH